MQNRADLVESIRQTLAECGQLAVDVTSLDDTDDLYDAGLTSLNTVNLMLAVEDFFDCEFPEEMLSRETFQSIQAIAEAVRVMTA
jgi:acyl carrier protein